MGNVHQPHSQEVVCNRSLYIRFPSLGIMTITSQKTDKAFYSYIKVNEEEHAEMLAKHWTKNSSTKQLKDEDNYE